MQTLKMLIIKRGKEESRCKKLKKFYSSVLILGSIEMLFLKYSHSFSVYVENIIGDFRNRFLNSKILMIF